MAPKRSVLVELRDNAGVLREETLLTHVKVNWWITLGPDEDLKEMILRAAPGANDPISSLRIMGPNRELPRGVDRAVCYLQEDTGGGTELPRRGTLH